MTHGSDLCLSRDWQVKISRRVSGSAVFFAFPAALRCLALQPVPFGGMVSRTLAPHLQCGSAGTQQPTLIIIFSMAAS